MKLQQFTKLKIDVVKVADGVGGYVLAHTPHKWIVEIKLTATRFSFIFGNITETKRDLKDIINELVQLEEEAKNHLLNKWNNNKIKVIY